MGSGFSKMKKQAKLMQEKFAKMQEEMEKVTEEGSSGSGLVKITLNGEKKIKNLSINPECVDPEDVEALQDLIITAYNDACEKIDNKTQQSPGLGAGLGGMGLPF